VGDEASCRRVAHAIGQFKALVKPRPEPESGVPEAGVAEGGPEGVSA